MSEQQSYRGDAVTIPVTVTFPAGAPVQALTGATLHGWLRDAKGQVTVLAPTVEGATLAHVPVPAWTAAAGQAMIHLRATPPGGQATTFAFFGWMFLEGVQPEPA